MTAKPSTVSKKPTASSPPLHDWLAQHLAPNAHVQMRLRGNILHVLCETPNSLHQAGAIARLVEALLAAPAGTDLITDTYPHVYQLYLYSRPIGQAKPDWTAPIYLNRLERHHHQLQQQAGVALKIADTQGGLAATAPAAAIAAPWHQDEATTALVLSHLSLARQGDPNAIAWYLSEVLSTLDVGVWVSVRAASGQIPPAREAVTADPTPPTDEATAQRLWVWCEATYSPDPQLIAEPVTERLRQLALTQFKDAVIVIQVHGEDTPDWSLRVDLTPATEMLEEWGRWGDEGAIAQLLNLAVAELGAEIVVERKEESLHCIVQAQPQAEPAIPPEAAIMGAIAPRLETLAPQGLHRAVFYGQAATATTPEWVRCLNLPALEHPALADNPTVLAQQGDLPALAYLLTRLLNPDLEAQLATGGIRVQVLGRDHLLHVMADAPLCPTRRQVVPQVLDFIEALQLRGIKGIRLYGRRAGQQRPAWSYGQDFQDRPPIVPQAEPVFAVSDSYVGDLLARPEAADLAPETDAVVVAGAIARFWQRSLERGRQLLFRTQLVVPQSEFARTPELVAPEDSQDVLKIGLVWGTVGLLLALQVDWIVGQIMNPNPQLSAVDAAAAADRPPTADEEALPPWDSDLLAAESFDSDEATTSSPVFDEEALIASPERSLAPTPDLLSHSPYPSLRSQQMDEKLALYHQRLAESGPPDVLIIGSSRALRGVDPAALQRELAALGHGDLSVFNFGVNGATAQVVDLTLRRVLEPHQLPRLILWADGARAVNSERTDVTFNASAASEGYRELGRRRPDAATPTAAETPPAAAAETPIPIGESLRASYQALDQTLSDRLGERSAVYGERDRLKAWVRDRLLTPLVAPIALSLEESEAAQNTSDMPLPEGSRIDFDGFLSLDVRFNPATYYQLYARVPGAYDSDYENFGLEGDQMTAFRQLLQYTQAQDIPVVFVNTPLTDEYLDGYRTAAEEDFQRMMLRLSATEEDFIFRDLGQVWTNRYDYFSDPSHLNRYGAYQVALQIAQDPMIPWPRARDRADSEAMPLP
ncbi:MAG TPA: hypothetical protein V6D02_16620 [Candidatus Obscuribacterales bacterium]